MLTGLGWQWRRQSSRDGRQFRMELVVALELKTTGHSLQMTGWSLIEWPHPAVLVFFKASMTVVALLHHNGGELLNNFTVKVVG